MKLQASNPFPYTTLYFIGIGGIGMSALARYFKARGVEKVLGYDLTPSPLTDQLQQEGIPIHFTDRGEAALEDLHREDTLVVYTPAVPESLGELTAFRQAGFRVEKRAQALGEAVAEQQLYAVAGTHGKTTTSTLLAHCLHSSVGTNAFLGGISANLKSNLLIDATSQRVVAEADEYDRSFLRLYPYCAIVTATSPDHLDIYGTPECYRESFRDFVGQIEKGGTLFYRQGSFERNDLPQEIHCYSYLAQWRQNDRGHYGADIYSDKVRIEEGMLCFDWHFPEKGIHFPSLKLPTPFLINAENATATVAASLLAGATEEQIREALATFGGVKRRFEFVLRSDKQILIDDYAHHPEELKASISSIRRLFPHEPILGIFQPHLYSRTQDFYHDFAKALSVLDQVILLPIYPAREAPIPGVTSELILEELPQKEKYLVEREELLGFIRSYPATLPRVVITIGAGNIDRLVPPLATLLKEKRDD